MAPEMPDQHDTTLSYYFHGNLTSLNHTVVPSRADESMLITLGLGSVCRRRGQSSCKRSGSKEAIIVATMNNISFQLPATTMPLLEAHYHHTGDLDTLLQELPSRPPIAFNFTDRALIPRVLALPSLTHSRSARRSWRQHTRLAGDERRGAQAPVSWLVLIKKRTRQDF